MITKTTIYTTSDGLTFDDEASAMKHEGKLQPYDQQAQGIKNLPPAELNNLLSLVKLYYGETYEPSDLEDEDIIDDINHVYDILKEAKISLASLPLYVIIEDDGLCVFDTKEDTCEFLSSYLEDEGFDWVSIYLLSNGEYLNCKPVAKVVDIE
jgi:hypothetical protein